ncbi:MAG TPA: hypothetical protein VLY21_04455 [Nitrososphaerales archaeon]|nr:hypothetical protein [Nitrososphaerales archaeon]
MQGEPFAKTSRPSKYYSSFAGLALRIPPAVQDVNLLIRRI